MNNYTLNIAAGNEYKVAVNIAKTDTELMKQEKLMQQDLATSQASMQEACYNEAYKSAANAKRAIDNEATGLDEAGTASAVTSGLSIASLTPHSVLDKVTFRKIKFGPDAVHNELENVQKFRVMLDQKQGYRGARLKESSGPDLTKNVRMGEPTGNSTVDRWLGNGKETFDVRGFCAKSDEQHLDNLSPNELKKLREHINTRRNELNEKIHNHSESKRSNFANATNNYGMAAGNLAQGTYKQDQAENDKRSRVDSAQNQIDEQICSSISNFSQQTDQAAGNYSEAGLSILANLNTQG
ncbi:MAG TPA: hypothetical protein VLE96_05740 [Chlamydiales bacterium]|nr:hypothetical protein [Chlamydiales bacterium]